MLKNINIAAYIHLATPNVSFDVTYKVNVIKLKKHVLHCNQARIIDFNIPESVVNQASQHSYILVYLCYSLCIQKLYYTSASINACWKRFYKNGTWITDTWFISPSTWYTVWTDAFLFIQLNDLLITIDYFDTIRQNKSPSFRDRVVLANQPGNTFPYMCQSISSIYVGKTTYIPFV